MIVFLQFLILFNLTISLCFDFINVSALFVSSSYVYGFLLLIISIYGVVINLLCLYYISISKRKTYKYGNFLTLGILEILSGGIISGILLLFVKDEHFEKEEHAYIKQDKKVKKKVEKKESLICPFCGKSYHPFDKVCSNCGFVLRKEKEITDYKPLSYIELLGCNGAIRYEKNRLKDLINEEDYNKIRIDSFMFNDYHCNVKSFDFIDDKLVRTFINVKSFYSNNLNELIDLSTKEKNMLRFHKNFKIIYIYNLNEKMKIKIINHDNYKQYI